MKTHWLVLLLACLPLSGSGAEPKAGNIAPLGKATASSSRPEYPLSGVNDNRMETQWSTALGQTKGQWLQLDWDEAHALCGVLLLATGPWTQTINVQARRDGNWVSIGHSGSAERRCRSTR